MVGQPILNNMYTGGGVLAYTANMLDLINKDTGYWLVVKLMEFQRPRNKIIQ